MTRATDVDASTGVPRPAWLDDAPAELQPVLEIGFEMYGDDPAAIASWISKLHDYKQFWSLVEGQGIPLEDRYAQDEALQAQVADARAHPERRVPRPTRRTA